MCAGGGEMGPACFGLKAMGVSASNLDLYQINCTFYNTPGEGVANIY
jgi:hypothetical protein